jgi:hypothetical protein
MHRRRWADRAAALAVYSGSRPSSEWWPVEAEGHLPGKMAWLAWPADTLVRYWAKTLAGNGDPDDLRRGRLSRPGALRFGVGRASTGDTLPPARPGIPAGAQSSDSCGACGGYDPRQYQSK